MTNYNYTGVTAYITESTLNPDRLRLLAELIWPFAEFADMSRPLPKGNVNILARPEARIVSENNGDFIMGSFCLPISTPDAYTCVNEKTVTINGQNFVRLYIPVTRGDENKATVDHGVIPLLEAIYKTDLYCVKTKTAMNFENFTDAKEQVVLSSDRFK